MEVMESGEFSGHICARAPTKRMESVTARTTPQCSLPLANSHGSTGRGRRKGTGCCSSIIIQLLFLVLTTLTSRIQAYSSSFSASSASSSSPTVVVNCGDMRKCSSMFRQATLSHNLSYDLSNKKIEDMCLKLNEAVRCFNNYRKMCLTNDEYFHTKLNANFYDQLSEGPLGLTMELCNNTKFRQDYLTLAPCQKRYSTEFDGCLRKSQQQQQQQQSSRTVSKTTSVSSSSSPSSSNTLFPNSNNNNNGGNGNPSSSSNHHNSQQQQQQSNAQPNSTLLERFIENCCALHNYHNCIYDVSLDKCGKDAANFSLKILELFNRGYLRDCAKYANLAHLCTNNRGHLTSASAPSSSWQLLSIVSSLSHVAAYLFVHIIVAWA